MSINWSKAEENDKKNQTPLWNPGTKDGALVGYEGQIIFMEAPRELKGPKGPFKVVRVTRTDEKGDPVNENMTLSKQGLREKVESLKFPDVIGQKFVLGVSKKYISTQVGNHFAPVILMTEEQALKEGIWKDTE